MFCKKKATLLVAILCVFAVSFVACSKKDAVSSGAATSADGATSQEVTKADKKAEEKKAKESKKSSSGVKLPTTPNAEEDFIVSLTEDGTGAVVTGYKGKSGKVYVPATIQGLPVKEVSFSIDDGVETVVVVSDGCTSVSLSGESIKYISLPDSVTEYGVYRTGITEFEVPAGVKKVGRFPPTLEKISFRGTPEVIGYEAFQGTKIQTITLPDSIKGIESYAFENCIALESINFPASLEWIGGEAITRSWMGNNGKATFNGCSNLKEIIIPDSLTSVDFPEYLPVFEGCSSLPLATQARLKQLGYEKSF